MRLSPLPSILIPAFVIAASFAAPFAGPAASQTVPSPYQFIDNTHELGGYAAVVFENRGDLDLGPGGGILAGIRYGVELGGPFGVDVHGFFFPSDRNVYDPTPETAEEAPVFLGNTSSLIAGIEGRARFNLTGPRTWNNLAPYLSAGGGVIGDLQARTALEEELFGEERFTFGPSFLGTGGIGTRWLPAANVTIRIEGLANFWKLGTPPAFFQLAGEDFPVPDDQWARVGMITLGGSYTF